MGSTDYGVQNNVFRYESPADSQIFNHLFSGLLNHGVFQGGEFTGLSNIQISVAEMTIVMLDVTSNVSVRIETQSPAIIALDSTQPFVIARYVWINTETNYMDIISLPQAEILSTDIILGRAEFSLGVLTGFDYSQKHYASSTEIAPAETLRVYPSDPYSNQVRIESGTILFNGEILEVEEQVSPEIIFPSVNPYYASVSLNDRGEAEVYYGIEAVSPVKRVYPALNFPLVQILLTPGETIIKGGDIEDDYIDIYYSGDNSILNSNTNVLLEKGREFHTIKAGTTISGNDVNSLDTDFEVANTSFNSNTAVYPDIPTQISGYYVEEIYTQFIKIINGKYYQFCNARCNTQADFLGTLIYSYFLVSSVDGETWNYLWGVGNSLLPFVDVFPWGTGYITQENSYPNTRLRYVSDPDIGSDVSVYFGTGIINNGDYIDTLVYSEGTGVTIVQLNTTTMLVSDQPDLSSWVLVDVGTLDEPLINHKIGVGTNGFVACLYTNGVSIGIYGSTNGTVWTELTDDFGVINLSFRPKILTRDIGVAIVIFHSANGHDIELFDSTTGLDSSFVSRWSSNDINFTVGLIDPVELEFGDSYLLFSGGVGGGNSQPYFLYYKGISGVTTLVGKRTNSDYIINEYATGRVIFSDDPPSAITPHIYNLSTPQNLVPIYYGYNEGDNLVHRGYYDYGGPDPPDSEGLELIQGNIPLISYDYIDDNSLSFVFMRVYGVNNENRITDIIANNYEQLDTIIQGFLETESSSATPASPFEIHHFNSPNEKFIGNDPEMNNEITRVIHSNGINRGDPVTAQGIVVTVESCYINGDIHTFYMTNENDGGTEYVHLEVEGGNDLITTVAATALGNYRKHVRFDVNTNILYASTGANFYWTADYNPSTKTLSNLNQVFPGATAVYYLAVGNGIVVAGRQDTDAPNLIDTTMEHVVFSEYDQMFYLVLEVQGSSRFIARSSDMITYEFLLEANSAKQVVPPSRDADLPIFSVLEDELRSSRYGLAFTYNDFLTIQDGGIVFPGRIGNNIGAIKPKNFKNYLLITTMDRTVFTGTSGVPAFVEKDLRATPYIDLKKYL